MRKWLISSTFLIVAVVIIFPFCFIAAGAFHKGIPQFLSNLARPEALHAYYMSLIIVITVTLLNLVVGTYLAHEVVRGSWLSGILKPFLNIMIDLPFAVSPVIAGLMIVLLFGPHSSLGLFFQSFGLKIVFALPGIIMATVFVTFPLMIREIVPVLEEKGNSAEEASMTMGAGALSTFFNVTLPSIRWAVLYGLVLTIARALGEFGAVLVVSGNIENQTQTATTLVYQDTENFNLAAANSTALMLGLVSIAVLAVMNMIKKRREARVYASSSQKSA